MKRLYLFVLVISFIIGLLPIQQVQANVSAEVDWYYDLPPEVLSQSRKTYEIPFPKDASSVLSNSNTYVYDKGNDRIVKFSPSKEKGIIEVTILGEKTTGTIDVTGYADTDGAKLESNPGNAFCRYSDGYDWQAATYNITDGRLINKRYTSNLSVTPKASIPPTDIPYGKVQDITTFVQPKFNIAATTWIDAGKNIIPSNTIDHSTVQLPKNMVDPVLGKPAYITNDTYDPFNPTIGAQYSPVWIKELDKLTNIPTSNPAFLTGHAICKMYPVTIKYTLIAKAKVDSYKYEGRITYKYIRSDDPAMLGELIADPNSVQFTDKDIKVKVTLNAEVINLKHPGALKEYTIYLRTADSSQNAPPIKVTANGKTTVTGSYEFTIPKSAMNGKEELTQIFNGRAVVNFKAGELYKGELDTGLLTASTYVYKKAPVIIDPPDTKPTLQRPVAIINGDSEVKLGDYTVFDAYQSYDPDGYIEEYKWTAPKAQEAPKSEWDPAMPDILVWYNELGPQRVELSVKDNDGLQNTTYHSLVVVEPTVEAAIKQTGILKENRKVTFTDASNSPTKYPVITSKIKWKIESVNGKLNDQIKYQGTLNGNKTFDVLFKKAGEYKVTLEVENTAGYTSSATKIVTIEPDEAPYVNFDFQKKIYRDPEKGNIATFTLKDYSYSFDGDTIASRNWYVIFDANNDGVFNESKVLFETGNKTEVIYETTHVGNYKFLLEAQEEFGQPTIEALVTANDRRKSNTWE